MAEMDTLISGFPGANAARNRGAENARNESFRTAWSNIMDLFDSNIYEEIDFLESCVYSIFRVFAILFVIPAWILMGFLTAGWLWPPQIREFLFVQKGVFKSRAAMEREKLGQLERIQTEVMTIKQDMMHEITSDREDAARIKSEIEHVHAEFLADLQQVKDLLESLAGGSVL